MGAVRTAARGDPDPGETGNQKICHLCRRQAREDVTGGLRLGDAVTHGVLEATVGKLMHGNELSARLAEFANRADSEAGQPRKFNDPFDHLSDTLHRLSLATKDFDMGIGLLRRISLDGRSIKLPLVSERIVEALPPDPHRFHKHVGRCALEPVVSKHIDGSVQSLLFVEFL